MAHYGFGNLESIKASIRALYSHLGNKQISIYNQDLKNPDFAINIGRDSDNIKRLAMVIGNHYYLYAKNVYITFKDLQDTPAQVRMLTPSDFTIAINRRTIFDSYDLLAVLAHEITHIYLCHIGLSFSNTQLNEILTDTTATYLGLGNVILNAYSEIKIKVDKNLTKFSTKWYGYLKPVEFGYIIAKRTKKFNNNPIPFLNREALDAYYCGHAALESEYKRPPLCGAHWFDNLRYKWHRRRAARKFKTNEIINNDYNSLGYRFEDREGIFVVIQCRSCLQMLRIPTFRGIISVNCPRCESTCICNP